MKLMSRSITGLVAALLAGCASSQLPSPPVIKAFSVDRPLITASGPGGLGQAVTLSYEVENATEVVIADQYGKELELSGDAKSGTAVYGPDRSTFFILRAHGEGGRDTAFVQVAVNEPLKDAFLVAVPPEVDAGGEVELLYSVLNATSVTLSGSPGGSVGVTGTSGVARVKPSATTTYTLTASARPEPENPGTSLQSTVKVAVRPVIQRFSATPPAARAGEKIQFSWGTAAGSSIRLTEAKLGELTSSSDPAQVAQGTFEWSVPALPYPDGYPLSFTLELTSSDPAMTVSKTLHSFMGEAPAIEEFHCPQAVTDGKPLTLTWRTLNANRVQIRANGYLVFEPLPGSSAIANGTFTVPSVTADATYELMAWSFNQLHVSRSQQVTVVQAPKVTDFTVPVSIGNPGDPATVSWTTENASSVALRVKGGGSVFYAGAAAQVKSGTAQLYPGTDTVYELVAQNPAGDTAIVEKTIKVGTPALLGSAPARTTPGAPVQVSYDLPTAIEVFGLPLNMAQPLSNSPNFVDLAADPQAIAVPFTDRNEAVAQLALTNGFQFPIRGETYSRFWVSTNGFVSLANTQARPANVSLATSNSLPPMFAPFWDDLDLGNGAIHYLVEGTSFPRRLIVQWTEVNIQGDPASSLTFQVQLFETGEAKFIYQTLTDANQRSQGQSATVGVNLRHGDFYGEHSFDNGVLSDGLELSWFGSTATNGSFTVAPKKDTTYSIAWRTASGRVVTGSARVELLRPGAIVITEAMPVPDPAFASGSWIELHNPNPSPFDLSGLTLTSNGSTTGDTFGAGSVIPPNGYLLLGQATDPALTGGATVQMLLTDVPLGASDYLKLSAGSEAIAVLEWSNATAGTSVQFGQRAINSSGTAQTCTRAKTFNPNMNLGSPGAENEICFEYLPMPILGRFEDLTMSGGGELLSSASNDSGYGKFPLAVPFKYFGKSYDEVQIAFDGYVTFGSSATQSFYTNASTPGLTEPNGVVAPLWDDLNRNTNGKMMMARGSDYTIISWQDFTFYGSTGTLNFQLKLFDSGVIEFHYGDLAADPARSSGSSATTWIEKPEGGYAQVVNINTAGVIHPHSGWRFTPKP